MSAAANLLAEVRQDAANLFHKIEGVGAALASEAPAAATVISDLEPVLGLAGIPGAWIADVANGIRALAARPEVAALKAAEHAAPSAADATAAVLSSAIPATPEPAPIA